MKILVIPDTHCKPGVNQDYLDCIGKYAADKKPDCIVHLGDHWDMPSLSSYDIGKKSFEGRRYIHDIEAGNQGMTRLLAPLRSKKKTLPKLIFCIGNHEQRIERAVESDSKLEGTIGYHDLNLSSWEVHNFLEPVNVNGIIFSHYFTTGVAGRPATTASALISKKHQSCIAGHQQGRQVAYGIKADGSSITAIIAGSCYEHDEHYLGLQGNNYWRGVLMLHEVQDGQFDEMFVSLKYLKEKYA